MKLRQWEVWKAKPAGFERAHWFVLISNPERLDSSRAFAVNALCCFTLRGEPDKTDVRLDMADGFDMPTVCQCDFIFVLHKRELGENRGSVTWERQQQIRARLKEVFRL